MPPTSHLIILVFTVNACLVSPTSLQDCLKPYFCIILLLSEVHVCHCFIEIICAWQTLGLCSGSFVNSRTMGRESEGVLCFLLELWNVTVFWIVLKQLWSLPSPSPLSVRQSFLLQLLYEVFASHAQWGVARYFIYPVQDVVPEFKVHFFYQFSTIASILLPSPSGLLSAVCFTFSFWLHVSEPWFHSFCLFFSLFYVLGNFLRSKIILI